MESDRSTLKNLNVEKIYSDGEKMLNKDTLRPLMKIINESQVVSKVASPERELMLDGRQKRLPNRLESIILKIFRTLQNCSFDPIGVNRDYISSFSVDERSVMKKFLLNSGP